jgi:hypothetical protein
VNAEQAGRAVHVLRWLSHELAAEKHPLAHVPAQLARALLEEPSAASCRSCGGELPAQERTGRPRVLCLTCSPRKTREKSTVATEPTIEEVA